MDKEKISEIIRILKEIRTEEKLSKWKDGELADCSVRIYNSEMIPKGDRNETGKKDWKTEPATSEQVAYAQKLGYEGNVNITKLEAKKIIEELKERRYKDKYDNR